MIKFMGIAITNKSTNLATKFTSSTCNNVSACNLRVDQRAQPDVEQLTTKQA